VTDPAAGQRSRESAIVRLPARATPQINVTGGFSIAIPLPDQRPIGLCNCGAGRPDWPDARNPYRTGTNSAVARGYPRPPPSFNALTAPQGELAHDGLPGRPEAGAAGENGAVYIAQLRAGAADVNAALPPPVEAEASTR
jgi:hypothetical protein